MRSTWLSVAALLVAFVNGARNDDDMQPCAQVQTPSLVVPLGSPVTATCAVGDSCPLAIGEEVHIGWHLGGDALPGSSVANASSGVSEVSIPSFNHTRAFLACSVQTPHAQVVGGVEIRAGFPPEAPQNLSCQSNLTAPIILTCTWDPGQKETYLPTKYTLYTTIRLRIYSNFTKNYSYELPPGVNHYPIPRRDLSLFSQMTIHVKAVNDLGNTTSVPITLEPISAAKFSPPTIRSLQAAPGRYGCLKLNWDLSYHESWVYKLMDIEGRLKTATSSQWTEKPILLTQILTAEPVDLCGLLSGTRYVIQIRVRCYGPWSEWSSSQSAVTLESAPTGFLDWWMEVSGDKMHSEININLFWKPSKEFRANSQNVSYVVVGRLAGGKKKVWSTSGNSYTFSLPRREKKVYLSAVNAAGKSEPTACYINLPKARAVISDLSAILQDDRSLLVQWRPAVSSSLTDFVVEWRPLLNKEMSLSQFEIADRDQTSLVIKGSFEAYKPYGIAVYPRFRDGMGLPQTVVAYSRQKAPSVVPKIQIKKTWHSNIEFTWDEIPLDQRNGILQSSKIFYWIQGGPINVVTVDPSDRRVVLNDLENSPLYEAFMMVSTSGGSLNGSTIHFEIASNDVVAIIVTMSGVGLSFLVIFTVVTCFSKHIRLRVRFWPAVPDPANSSIKRWTSDSTQDTYLASGSEEPNLIYLSHLSFLDLPGKSSKEGDDRWPSCAEDMSNLGESICGSPVTPAYSGSNSDSVPYATVIFSDPCNSPVAKASQVYLRSESKQPLLETEESSSPGSYQNMETDGMPVNQSFFGPGHDCVPEEAADPDILWDDFPFLRAFDDVQNDLKLSDE